jgi:two-component system nitrate/nitrite response regulator NarL
MSSSSEYMARSMKVLIVDDHGLVRAGIRALIQIYMPDIQFYEAANAAVAWEILNEVRIDVAFLDLDLQGAASGYDLLLKVRSEGIRARIIMLSATSDAVTVNECLKAGASGYVPKGSKDSSALKEAVEVTLAGGVYLPDNINPPNERASAPSTAFDDLDGLSPRLIEVLVCVCQGLPNKLIARQLGIAEGTVRKTYMTELLRYFGVARRTALMYEVARRGIRIPFLTHDESS